MGAGLTPAPSYDRVGDLSRWLDPAQRALLARGHRRVFFGGSGARELLDHALRGAPLALRDLDLFVLDERASPERVAHLAAEVAAVLGARVSREGVRTKRRADPRRAGEARDRHVIGYGAHLVARGRPVVSLGVVRSRDDLALSGLFDIDTLLVKLDHTRTLSEVAARLGAHRARLVDDPHRGWDAWCARSPSVVHRAEVLRCATRHSIRVARSLAKCSLRAVPDHVTRLYADAPARDADASPRELARDLAKLFSDRTWREELATLATLGTLARIAPSLAERLRRDPGCLDRTERPADTLDARVRVAFRDLGDPCSRALARRVAGVARETLPDRRAR